MVLLANAWKGLPRSEVNVGRNGRSSTSIHFVRAWVVTPFVRFLEARGCPVERHLHAAHLSPDLLEDDQTPLPTRPVYAFIERASRAEGIENLGLHVGLHMRPDDMGSLRTLMSHARNLHQYLLGAQRVVKSIASNAAYELRIDGETARFECIIDAPHALHSHLFTLAAAIATFRALAGDAWRPLDVLLPEGAADGLRESCGAFENARVDPDAPGSSFAFPRSFLALPAPEAGPGPTPPLETAFDALDAGGFRRAAIRLAEYLSLDGISDVRTAADAAGMTVRTFQRRLHECGLVYSQIVQEARITIAERWLMEEGRPVSDIAHSLGYSDASNFTRAFRRLNGVPPRMFRKASGE